MKHHHFITIISRNKLKIVFLLLTTLVFSYCKEDPQIWKKSSNELVTMEYINRNPVQYSEFEKLIESTGMDVLLKLRGPYTLFLPTNTAMQDYYKLKNVNSFTDFSIEFRESLVRNHLLASEITTGDIELGALRDTNAIGDYLVTEFEGTNIIINKSSKIIKRDINTANGYIDIIDKVLDPIKEDIFSVISSNPSFKIFTKGLILSGLKDTLQLVSFPFGQRVARTRFTVLAIADSTYERYGINNISDLIKWCGADSDSLSSINNLFYRYMEYHVLNGCYYLSDLTTQIYSILSRDNYISVIVDNEDYKINRDRKDKTKWTSFNIEASNTPAKNGTMHVINNLLPVIVQEPQTVIFETTDFFDIKQGDYFGKYYKKWNDGVNTFAKIHWEGDFMEYYYKHTQPDIKHYDCLSMNGWWSISVTFPKVMKGKYTVSIFQPSWAEVTNCVAYLDGKLTPYTFYGPRNGGVGGLQKIADADFKTTSEHTITLKNIAFGGLWWDYVQFDPVK